MKITEPLTKIMTEEEITLEFLPKLKTNTRDLFIVLEEFLKLKNYPSREMVFSIMKEVDRIETFLDDFSASHNKRFFYFRELIASMRWINNVIFQGLHVLARIESYRLGLTAEEKESFTMKMRKTVSRCLVDLRTLTRELYGDAAELGIRRPRAKFEERKNFVDIQKKILPPDIDAFFVKASSEVITGILVKFLESSEIFNSYFCRNSTATHHTEETLENYRSTFNRLESLYDTYLRNAEIEKKHFDLRGVRSSIAITLHLLEMGKALAHFYERHGEKLRNLKPVLRKAKFAEKEEIDSVMKDFLISYAISFLNRGKEFSSKIFMEMGREADEFLYDTRMLQVQSHRLEDFHIRPIMPVTQIANRYKLDTFLYQNRNKYNLKSAIEMAIAIPDIRDDLEKGNIEMMVQGPKKAVAEISLFFHDRCGAIEKEIVCNFSFSKKTE